MRTLALPRSLRVRLGLWYAVALALVISVFGGLLYGIVRHQLVRHHDHDLLSAASSVEAVLAERPDSQDLTENQGRRLDQIGQIIVLHETAGKPSLLHRTPDAAGLPLASLRDLTEAHATFSIIPVAPGQEALLRVYSRPFSSPTGRRGVIRVAHSLGDLPRSLTSLRLALLVLSPIAILGSAFAGYWLAGRALAPVDQMTRLAREIEAGSLSRRLPSASTDDEIGRLADTFNQMIARLESSFAAMRRFTADASHELRGPLATMRAAIDVALAQPRDVAEYRRALASVGEDVDRLRSITEDLLLLARADSGRIELAREAVDLDLLVREVCDSLQPVAASGGVRLDARCLHTVTIRGDEHWLRQLVFGLLDNAIKFSRPNDPSTQVPLVTVEVVGGENGATLWVRDTGPGIAERDRPHVFERFYRGDPARSLRAGEGTGLGLAIAAWIVRAHDGHIAVENMPAGGTQFEIRLPSAAATPGAKAAIARGGSPRADAGRDR